MATGGSPSETPTPHSPVTLARRSRFLGQQYADITKLRELAARHDHRAARIHQRIARINTRIDKLRHMATVLRERGQKALTGIPDLEQEIQQYVRDVETAQKGLGTGGRASDVTALQYRLRKLQQKVEDLKSRSRSLELRAALRTQKTSELKVRVDQLLETARLAEEEAAQHRARADRLQQVTDQESNTPAGPTGSAAPPPPPPA